MFIVRYTNVLVQYIRLAGNYEKASDLYSEAISLNPYEKTYWTNRSMAYLKREFYGFALADANEAIRLDRKFSKVLFYSIFNKAKRTTRIFAQIHEIQFQILFLLHMTKDSIAEYTYMINLDCIIKTKMVYIKSVN